MSSIATPPEQLTFLQQLARRLGLEGVPAEPRDLAQWLASCWPLIEEPRDVERWAREYRAALPRVAS